MRVEGCSRTSYHSFCCHALKANLDEPLTSARHYQNIFFQNTIQMGKVEIDLHLYANIYSHLLKGPAP